MKCLFGIYDKDSGKIELEGKEINFKNSKEALENGVAMVHQERTRRSKETSWIISGSDVTRKWRRYGK